MKSHFLGDSATGVRYTSGSVNLFGGYGALKFGNFSCGSSETRGTIDDAHGLKPRSPEVARKTTAAIQQPLVVENGAPHLVHHNFKRGNAMQSHHWKAVLVFVAYLILAAVHAPLDFLA